MSSITLRIIDGPDRGKVRENLPLPVTVGREETNHLVLNDERVSRFHLKFFEESGKTILVDLGSTNGTLVNGEPIQIWSVRPGDLILIGRTYLLFGSKQEISARLKRFSDEFLPPQRGDAQASSPLPYIMGVSPEETGPAPNIDTDLDSPSTRSFNFTFTHEKVDSILSGFSVNDIARLRSLSIPSIPTEIETSHRLWLNDLFLYLTIRLRAVTSGISTEESEEENSDPLFGSSDKKNKKNKDRNHNEGGQGSVTLSAEQWQNLLDLYALLAQYQSEIKPQKD